MKYWIVPANISRFRLHDYLNDYDEIEWKQGNYRYEVGDIVFIYCSLPEQRIRYMLRVERINVPKEEWIDDSMYSINHEATVEDAGHKICRFLLLKESHSAKLSLASLQANGLKSIPQSPRSLTGDVLEYILSVFDEVDDANLDYEVLDNADEIFEGAKKSIIVNRYERNVIARQQCIEAHGFQCAVCGLDFEEKYGELGHGFIHVHHIVPISTIGKEYKLDPVKDLIPVCPNCHAMLHHGKDGQVLTVKELKDLVMNKQTK